MTGDLSVTFLGTATSTGVPEIGCHCKTCVSSDPRDKRLRASVLLRKGSHRVVIDCGSDFREQMIREDIGALDALFITHEHYDHLGGLDDMRPLIRHGLSCPIYAEDNVIHAIRTRLPYVFMAHPYPGVPHLDLHSASPFVPIEVAPGFVVEPIRVTHGRLPILGFKVGDFVYITDAKTLPDETMSVLRGHTHTLVLNALRIEPHPTHLSLSEALDVRTAIAPTGETYFTHFAHSFGTHEEITAMLPPHVHAGYDGLTFEA